MIIANIQCLLQLWRLPNLKLEGKVSIFTILASSKNIFQIFKSPMPNQIM